MERCPRCSYACTFNGRHGKMYRCAGCDCGEDCPRCSRLLAPKPGGLVFPCPDCGFVPEVRLRSREAEFIRGLSRPSRLRTRQRAFPGRRRMVPEARWLSSRSISARKRDHDRHALPLTIKSFGSSYCRNSSVKAWDGSPVRSFTSVPVPISTLFR
jgi:hypothetical protein